MQINNSDYGGFIVSKNVCVGIPILHSYREKSSIDVCNGWTLYSMEDDDDYGLDPNNFEILSAESVYRIAPVMLEIFHAPYGTELFWHYSKDGTHAGFYDLKKERDVSIEEILRGM